MKDAWQLLDSPAVSRFLFYPRADDSAPPAGAVDLVAQTDEGVRLGLRLYGAGNMNPTVLYFHGNGEVASDYDELAPLYTQRRLNLLVADYRGYGKSSGEPSLGSVVSDATAVLDTALAALRSMEMSERVVLMGRSLGSCPAVYLAATAADRVSGLIIESGFACITRLLRHLGLDLGIEDSPLLPNLVWARSVALPALVLHAEQDTLIPISEAHDLFAGLGSVEKSLVTIPHAGHNDILYADEDAYFGAIEALVEKSCG